VARLLIEGSELVVCLSLLERIGAFVRNEPRVPVTSVRSVRAVADGWPELRGYRAPGTGLPGVIMLGTVRRRGERDFAAVYRHGSAIVVELQGATWSRFVVTTDAAEATVAAISR
jgi:hypothetical protein